MRTKQDSIVFPVRKTRSNTKPTKRHARTTRANNKITDPIDSDEEVCLLSSKLASPSHRSRENELNCERNPTPNRSRKNAVGREGGNISDDEHNGAYYSPRKLTQRRDGDRSRNERCTESSPVRCGKSASKQSARVEKIPTTPTKVTLLAEDIENILSPRKKLVVALEPLSDKMRQEHLSESLPQRETSNRLMSPVKCPLSPNGAKCALSPTKFSSPVTPRKLDFMTPKKQPLTPADLNSPKSAVKRLNLCSSPAKSPIRHLTIASPRRSPRVNQENIPYFQSSPRKLLQSPRKVLQSPRKVLQSPLKELQSPREVLQSPRKLAQSPLRFTSPASLMSKVSLNSPDSRRKIAISLFKPDVTAYRTVRQSLNTGTPTVLVCRERQVNEMREFLVSHIGNSKPGSLYVSGAPGTGKTASLNSILASMDVRGLKRVFLNCMALKTSAAIYKAILTELGHRVEGTEKENRLAIEKIVTSSKHTMLLMLDEVDQLDSKNQEVLYTIFEWPALAKSKLVLVGIANSLDLTDRILPRLQARPNFRPRLLHYPPYTKAEIISIINQRINEAGLGDMQVIRPAAIQLLAGKVASVSGDVRKALDVCRRAVELCEAQARKQAVLVQANASPSKALKMVDIPQVMSIFNEIYGSRVISAVTDAPDSFPLQQKVLICCYLLILKHARSKDITLGKFHEVYSKVCRKRQAPVMDQSEFLSMCTLLESRGMMQVKKSKEIRSSKVLLRLNAEEAEQTLGDRNLLANILEDKESLGKLCKNK